MIVQTTSLNNQQKNRDRKFDQFNTGYLTFLQRRNSSNTADCLAWLVSCIEFWLVWDPSIRLTSVNICSPLHRKRHPKTYVQEMYFYQRNMKLSAYRVLLFLFNLARCARWKVESQLDLALETFQRQQRKKIKIQNYIFGHARNYIQIPH